MDLRNYFSDVLEEKAIEPCIELVKKKAEADGQTIEETAKQIKEFIKNMIHIKQQTTKEYINKLNKL